MDLWAECAWSAKGETVSNDPDERRRCPMTAQLVCNEVRLVNSHHSNKVSDAEASWDNKHRHPHLLFLQWQTSFCQNESNAGYKYRTLAIKSSFIDVSVLSVASEMTLRGSRPPQFNDVNKLISLDYQSGQNTNTGGCSIRLKGDCPSWRVYSWPWQMRMTGPHKNSTNHCCDMSTARLVQSNGGQQSQRGCAGR